MTPEIRVFIEKHIDKNATWLSSKLSMSQFVIRTYAAEIRSEKGLGRFDGRIREDEYDFIEAHPEKTLHEICEELCRPEESVINHYIAVQTNERKEKRLFNSLAHKFCMGRLRTK